MSWSSLIKDGHVTRGYLGVMIQDVTPALAKEFKLKDTTGALVGDVTPKSPADKAGLKSGDLMVEFNGKKVTDSRHLKLEVARTQPGQTVPVKILRDGTAKDPRGHREDAARHRELSPRTTRVAKTPARSTALASATSMTHARQQFERARDIQRRGRHRGQA